MKYHSHYSDDTWIKLGQLASPEDIRARQIALRQFELNPIGEIWVAGYGYTCLFEGPALDKDVQNLLCLKEVPT